MIFIVYTEHVFEADLTIRYSSDFTIEPDLTQF